MHGNFYITSLILGNIPVQLCNGVRNLGFIFYKQLNLNEQLNNVKDEVNRQLNQ